MAETMTVRVAEIEHQLREIWKGYSRSESAQPVTRAHVMNLIVHTSNPQTEPDITKALADISTQSPGRMIVLIQDSSLSNGTMNSWVNALCHLASGGRKQICCEQIVIHGAKATGLQWSSVVLPLLIPDLPIFLWWHDPPNVSSDLLGELAAASDRLIIDTKSSPDFSSIVSLMEEDKDLSISDLNWTRITPWRCALAAFYEHPLCRICIQDLRRIEIDFSSTLNHNGQAYLLLAWFGSSLGWEWSDKTHFKNATGKNVEAQLNKTTNAVDQVLAVRLYSADGEFKVFVSADGMHLQTEILVASNAVAGEVVRLPQVSLSALLSQEVSILGHDAIYERSLRFLVQNRMV